MRANLLVSFVLIVSCAAKSPPAAALDSRDDEFPGLAIEGAPGGLAIGAADVLSLDDDAPFALSTHTWMTEELRCGRTLARAHYRQDIVMQAASKAHFDNCDFESALAYLKELVGAAEKSANDKRAEDAISNLGRAMHALQDFYAHSNYVEIMAGVHERFEDVPIVELWQPSAANKLKWLRENKGLVSGYVSWGIPKLCAAESPTHGDLAKDSSSTKSGQLAMPRGWGGRNGFQAARDLARKETLTFLRVTLARWPELRNECGLFVPVVQQGDRRP